MRSPAIYITVVLTMFIVSCADKYVRFAPAYSFGPERSEPDYSRIEYWAAHPWKHDPSDSVPAPLAHETMDTLADVFFIHPTTYTKNIAGDNADINDSYLAAKTDYTSILYQASVFNRYCRIFSPRYRQASLPTFFLDDTMRASRAFDLAYMDIRKAFEYYLFHWNQGRPIIIAGHSQGGKMAERLLKDYFEHKPLYRQLVVAYVIGWPVPREYFSLLRVCEDSVQTGCICSWRTLRNGYLPSFLVSEKGDSYVTNPLSWTTADSYSPRSMNKGSVLTHFNKVYKHTTDGRISNGLLYVKRPRFPWSFLYRTRNYHIGDINLYYLNLRSNIGQRIRSFVSH